MLLSYVGVVFVGLIRWRVLCSLPALLAFACKGGELDDQTWVRPKSSSELAVESALPRRAAAAFQSARTPTPRFPDPCRGVTVTGIPIPVKGARTTRKRITDPLPPLRELPPGSLGDVPTGGVLLDFCRMRKALVTENPDELLSWLLPRLRSETPVRDVFDWLGPHDEPVYVWWSSDAINEYWLRRDRVLRLVFRKHAVTGVHHLVEAHRATPRGEDAVIIE